MFKAFIRDLTGLGRDQDELGRRARLVAGAEELVHMGTWERDLRTGRALWSDELYRILGFEPGAVEPSVDLALELAHPEDRENVARLLSSIVETPKRIAGEDITLEYRAVRPDGTVRELRARGRVETDEHGEPAWWVGSALDVTELRLTERELQAHDAVGNSLRDWTSFEEDAVGLLGRLGTALDFSLGCVWTCDSDRDELNARAFWSAPGVEGEEFKAAARAITLRPGQGVAGRAWQSAEPVFSEDVTADGFAPREPAGTLGLRFGLAFAAVTDEGQPLAVLGYYGFDRRVPSKRLIRTLSGIGRELGRFFSHHRSELGPSRLTNREVEILSLTAEGNTGPAIAKRLGLSPSTVRSHFEHIHKKLGVNDRAAAVAHALRIGLIS